MHNDRIKSALSLIESLELDAAILFDPAAQYYLIGHDSFAGVNTPQALILSPRLPRPCMVIWEPDAAMLPASGAGLDVHHYRFGVDNPANVVAEVLAAHFPPTAQFGWDAQSAALNHALASEILASTNTVPVDITIPIARLRVFKSDDEIASMRTAGKMVELGLAALRHALSEGTTEHNVAMQIETALRQAGSDYWAVPIEMASGDRSHYVHGTPTDRVLQSGDLLHVEFGAVHRRYHAVGLQTVAVGNCDPKAAWLYDVARRCLAAGIKVARPGIPAAAIEEPALNILRAEGLPDKFAMRFGYSVGVGYPPSWLEPFGITRTNFDIVERNMTFVLHASLLDKADKLGVVVGGTYAMAETGLFQLAGAGDCDLYCAKTDPS